MASANESIKLIVRATNHKYPDFKLELSSTLTVYDLKQNIALNHPANPAPKDQRLIFSGKLLDDGSLLSQVFIKSSSGSSFMVHLVLDSDKNATTPKKPQPKAKQTPPIINQQPPIPEKSMPTSPHSNAYEQYLGELNNYQEQLQQFLINPIGNVPVCNSENQAYLQCCYTHYQMYQNLLSYQRTVISPSSPITTNIPNASQQTSSSDTNGTTSPPPPAAPAQQQQNNNNNNNDGEQENDLLGVLNMLVELFVLCSIIYFYSTFSRFLVVFFIFALLYLHCRGYLSIHRRRRAQPAPAPVAPEQPAAAAANEGEQGGDEENEPEAAANEAQNQNNAERQRAAAPPPTGPVEENQITTSRLLLTAVSTFFSSLIPERPQRA